jgi:DNA polymerase-3 subunit alpha (Gram-positive type)
METTGLDPLVNGVVEVGAIIKEDGKPAKTFSGLCNPGDVVISEYAMQVNGLSIEYLQQECEPIGETLRRFDKQFNKGAVICGHNVSGFDIPFLKAAYKREKMSWRFHHHCVDTMVLANAFKMWGLIPRSQSLSLQNLLQYFEVEVAGEAHRALPDVYAAIAVMDHLKDITLGGSSYGV